MRRKGEGENACSTCRTGLLGGGGAAAAVRGCDRRKRHCISHNQSCNTRLGNRRQRRVIIYERGSRRADPFCGEGCATPRTD